MIKKLYRKYSPELKDVKRQHKDQHDDIRNQYQIDRDRILYSNAFRRLSGKTQVFCSGYKDHMRTRLTHTLEVAQIAKTIADNLGLDTVLTEAIALGHDIGHTPFGHAGEFELNEILNNKNTDFTETEETQKGFKHNWQGLRVLADLESEYLKFKGLNISNFTLWGILNHTEIENKDGSSVSYYENTYKKLLPFFQDSFSFEGTIVKLADEIAQRHHDMEDALCAKIIDINDLMDIFSKEFSPFGKEIEQVKIKTKKYKEHSLAKVIVSFYVKNLIESVNEHLNELSKKPNSLNNFVIDLGSESIRKMISYKTNFEESDIKLQKKLKTIILHSHLAEVMDGRSKYIIRKLVKAYKTNLLQLPDKTILTLSYNVRKFVFFEKENSLINLCKEIIKETRKSENYLSRRYRDIFKEFLKEKNSEKAKALNNILLRTIADMISGMTDQFAFQQYEKLYGTSTDI